MPHRASPGSPLAHLLRARGVTREALVAVAIRPSADWVVALLAVLSPHAAEAQDTRLEAFKAEALRGVEARAELVQEIVDMLFSFGELGMQEFET